ncbi:MAG: hypothetical protein ABIP17_05970 [Ilumatobacteraceae bacterium]
MIPNTVVSKVGVAGTVCFYTLTGTDLIADVNGYVPANGSPQPLSPARLLETRKGSNDVTIDGAFPGAGRAAAGSTTQLTVTGRGGVPAKASTVVLNVGAVLPSGPGFLTVYPCNEKLPVASNVDDLGGDVISNAVVAKVGTDGKVCIDTLTETDIIADVFATDSAPVPFRTS